MKKQHDGVKRENKSVNKNERKREGGRGVGGVRGREWKREKI